MLLDAETREYFDLPIVHLDRTRDGDLSFRVRENFPDPRLEIENSGGAIELLQHGVEDRSVRGHSGSLGRKDVERH
jgi:hypothetical protein